MLRKLFYNLRNRQMSSKQPTPPPKSEQIPVRDKPTSPPAPSVSILDQLNAIAIKRKIYDEANKYTKMKLFLVESGKGRAYVVATGYNEAISKWQHAIAIDQGGKSPGLPDKVTLLDDGETLIISEGFVKYPPKPMLLASSAIGHQTNWLASTLSPVECRARQLQLKFEPKLGCAELEHLASHVFLKLCDANSWDVWLNKSDCAVKVVGADCWSHEHWVDKDAVPCLFDRYVEYHPTIPDKFKVNSAFIAAMMPTGGGPIPLTSGMVEHHANWLKLSESVGEIEACTKVADRLRELADIVERGQYPQVFGWTDEGEPKPIASYTLTLSHPWGG